MNAWASSTESGEQERNEQFTVDHFHGGVHLDVGVHDNRTVAG
ncbi:hypothetical protein [Streptomyces sp. NPDC001315]